MFDKQNKYYVYIYLDPTKSGNFKYKGINKVFKFEPFYVGKGTGKRKFYHLYSAKNGYTRKSECQKYCTELLSLNFEPIIIEYKSNMFEEDAYNLEYDLINKIGRKCHNLGPLLNYHFGGQLKGHDVHTEEMKKRLSDNHYFNRKDYKPEDHWAFGKLLSEETRQAISNAHKGKIMQEDTKNKIKETLKKTAKRGNEHYTRNKGFSEDHLANLKQARRGVDRNKIKEIFDIMIKHNHTVENRNFNKIKYELARSKLFAKRYPKWESVPKFFTEEEVKHYFKIATNPDS